ncbi:hypothetical protein [Caldisericum sp.]|uniref:hypothetical protein n=1 Tax=Caldisericum sp. TaxID=2499687 RepID=UPI003D0EDA83
MRAKHIDHGIYTNITTKNRQDLLRFLKRYEKGIVKFSPSSMRYEMFLLSYIQAWKERIPLKASGRKWHTSFLVSLGFLDGMLKLNLEEFQFRKEFLEKVIDLVDGRELLNEPFEGFARFSMIRHLKAFKVFFQEAFLENLNISKVSV